MLDDGEDGLLAAALRALAPGRAAEEAYEDDLRHRALHVVPSRTACRRIVYTTKVDWLVYALGWPDHAPDDVALVWRQCPVGRAHAPVVRALVESCAAPVVFVGDLDPLDLATYGTLARALDGLPLRYAGVGNAWVRLCERHLSPTWTRLPCIPMSEDERQAVTTAEADGLGWADLAGPRGMELLGEGLKLELEGASNPGIYAPALAGEIARLILE
ncbi:MAG: hypothetical protein ABW221_25375 [Vicinamibacteria bacterium]